MKYDDCDYHSGGEFPADVPEDHAWTHIGVFLTWLIEHDLHDPSWEPLQDVAPRLRARSAEPRDLIDVCDGALFAEMLSAEGNAFTQAMYERYLAVYEERMSSHVNGWRSIFRRISGSELTAYHADPGWPTYDVMKPEIDALHANWHAGRRPEVAGAWTRNYAAMGDGKLMRSVEELRARRGDAFDRVLDHAADPDVHLAVAERVARERGLI